MVSVGGLVCCAFVNLFPGSLDAFRVRDICIE